MFNINDIPKNPGCYLFKDKKDKIIYIGKAKNLKKRINTYFQKTDHDIKTKSMISHIENIDFMITDSELEAIILENTLIKKHQPPYNIRLKDAKSHSYLLLTNEKYPRVLIARNKKAKGKYYGPFISASERDYILQFLKRTFQLRTCKKLPKKPCLRYHIKLCEAPCRGNTTSIEYNKKIENIKMVLNGKINEVIKKNKNLMNLYSKQQKFEKALQIRNQIKALEHLNERQKMQREKKYNEDILNYLIKDEKIYMMLFNIYRGLLHNKNDFVFDNQNGFLEDFIIQYYNENPVPKELIIPEKISDTIQDYLSQIRGSKVIVNKPQKGEKKQLLDLVLKNIEISFFKNMEKINSLKKILNFQETPDVIECFDISHISGSSTVGSMVQFRNGQPDKNNYRRFKIKTVEGIDDTAAIAEIVRRRYSRLKREHLELPNLIIIDGGRAQLNFALHELENLDLKIPIISIAKKFEEIYIPINMKPIRFSNKEKGLCFIQEIRDEAHRFAIKYNRLLRSKKVVE